ncbi:DUF202 domain-containing protein [Mycobacterium sp. Aquia_216]|uniref:DUF202 domain-containing protein n=1 Tax=Mycobacterium sp. Aquia_216 TaxID=2991729 RepID=UPI003FA3DBE5
MPREEVTRDPGLQPERTALAWTRTALAGSTAGAVIVLRDRDVASLLHSPARLCIGGTAIVVALCTFGLGWRRRRQLAAQSHPPAAPARRDIIGVAVAVTLLSTLVLLYLLIALS